jgi:hypothetical protein
MLEGLRDYAHTDIEHETLEAVIAANGNRAEAARKLGKAASTVKACIIKLEGRQDADPTFNDTSTLIRHKHKDDSSTGKVLEWVKVRADRLQQKEMMREFTKAFFSNIEPLKAIPAPKKKGLDKDIIPWFQMGDAHIGMLARESEVGHSFNLEIAERELIKAFQLMIERAPDCERCVFQDLGDGTHFENFAGVTEGHGHKLDTAGSFPQVIRVYARIMRAIIGMLLVKFKFVDTIVNQGNHSRKNDIWAAVMLEVAYENNPRFKILNNDSVFIPYRMGNVFVLCHHTDKCKPAQLAAVMANDFAHDWGETAYHYIDGGHVHHRQTAKELNGAIYESWNQLAPSDKYAHDGGWRSRSCLNVVLRSKTYGEKGRITVTAEEVKDLLDNLPEGTTAAKRREVYTV